MRGLTHVRWIVRDMGPMIAFYRDTLGFKVVVDVPGTYAEVDTGGARVGICAAALMADVVGAPVATGPGDDVLVQIRVDDVDAAAAFVRAKGVALVTEPHDQPAWLMRIAHVRDPAGHLIELFTPLARA
jgi:catechol 2,3-dioxygenase-like lactoylglutathione lyase family enzyme